MKLTRIAVERPLAMLMFVLALVILGWRGYTMLQVDRYPAIDIPYVAVVVVYPGASPEDLEDQVVKPIEDAVAGVSGIDILESTVRESIAITSIQFHDSVSANQAAADVERAIATIKSTLPADAEEPSIVKADLDQLPIMNIAVSGPQALDELYRITDDTIKSRLLATQGVAAVTVSGGLEREVQVLFDPTRLVGYQVPVSQISGVLARENVNFPAGAVSQGRQRTAIRSMGRFSSVEEIENLIISAGQKRIYLRDVAAVGEGNKETEEILRLNGQDTVSISISKQADANTVETADNVHETIAELQDTLPEGMALTVINDDSEFTRSSVDAVQKDLLLAVIITGAVLLLFLHTLRSTLIVLLSVPTSLISTFLVMWVLGFSLNMLTLLALALTIGILVDDSIVVLENIFRHLSKGEAPADAAISGRSEIGMAAMAITLCDVVVYLPVAFMSGVMGQFFREYGITIATATMFSLFISFTLTPLLASRWLKGDDRPSGLWGKFVTWWERAFDGLANTYAGVLGWSLHRRPLVLLIAFVALVGAVAFIPLRLLGTEFMPVEDDNVFIANIKMPAGSSLQATDRATKQFEDIVSQVPEVDKVLAQVGSRGASFFGSTGGPAGSTVTVKLVEKQKRSRTVFDIVEEMRIKAADIPDANFQFATSTFIGGGGAAPLQVQVAGPEIDALIELSVQVENVMRGVPGVSDIRNVEAERSPEFQAVLDRGRMSDLGVSAVEAGSTLRTALSGSQASTLKREGQPELDITLIAAEKFRSDPKELERLPIKFANDTPVNLGQIAKVEEAQAPAQIKRYNRERTLNITASVVDRTVGDVAADIDAAIAEQIQIPAGYRVEQRGAAEEQSEAFGQLISALFLSILLMYMLMVALYESLMQPLAIMFSLPVSMVGAFGGLFLTGNTLNIFSMLGIIMLMGLVTKNAILLVDFTDILRERGYGRYDALVEAGRLRLRPILMTTAAIVFAMVPLVLKLEAGAETRAPLAAAVMGGVISSTLLTLVLVPTVYTYLDSLEAWIRIKILRQTPRFQTKTTPQGQPEPIPHGAS